MSGADQRGGGDPVVGPVGAQVVRGLMSLGARAEEAEDGGAGAGHTGEDAAVDAGEAGFELTDDGDQSQRRRFEVVAGFVEPEAELRGSAEWIGERRQRRIV